MTGHQSSWDLERRADLLSWVRPFSQLDRDVLNSVASQCRVRSFQKGEIIFVEGQPAGAIYVLADGEVRVVRETDDAREVILRLIRPGELFGGAGGWGASHYPATTIASARSDVLALAATEFSRLIEEHPAFATGLIRELSMRLREAESRIQELQTERVERRIARMLMRLANRTGRRIEQGIEIDATLSRQAIADLCGTTLSTASRILASWDQRGILISAREHVVIVRTHELVAIADDAVSDSA
ncbi:MAG: Crp/Fnr family transcriptional regulator [Thermomicrobiales bacterium]|nr:Crp/Fnr family transcriptional regulator [Thermomicrobiales bacterium]